MRPLLLLFSILFFHTVAAAQDLGKNSTLWVYAYCEAKADCSCRDNWCWAQERRIVASYQQSAQGYYNTGESLEIGGIATKIAPEKHPLCDKISGEHLTNCGPFLQEKLTEQCEQNAGNCRLINFKVINTKRSCTNHG